MSTDSPQPTRYKVDALLVPNQSTSSPVEHTFAPLVRVNASALADATQIINQPASIILKPTITGYEITASGTKSQIDQMDLPASIMEITLRDRLLIPALVNAHTHLDLTHIGPIAHNPADGFVKWVDHIRANRQLDDSDIRSAVALGIQASLAGGSIAVGDIAGAPMGRITDAPAHELAASPLIGVSYLEFFGIGTTAPAAITKINHYLKATYPQSLADLQDSGVKIGLQPHAPNTVDLSVYRWAAAAARARSMPLSTHLAETPEEREFIADGTGPQRTFLERFGIWHDSILDHIAKSNHPVEHLAEVLTSPVARLAEPGSSSLASTPQKDPARRAGPPKLLPFLVAHVNDATDAAIEILASTNTSVAYCPRASTYFGADHHFGPHRYRDMLAVGVNVCLGTDSIVNLDTPDRISILDEMRHLHRRDATDPITLLQLATTNGARALGLDDSNFTLAPNNHPLGLLAIPIEPGQLDSWTGAMQSNEPPEWVFL
jgi:aminodeoxyfutalosine deaminase